MKEIYHLNQSQLPSIPIPHDCVIEEIRLEEKYLVFVFENDISCHESIQYTVPDAKSLIIRFHLEYEMNDISLFIRKRLGRLLHKFEYYREIDLTKSPRTLLDLTKGKLEYIQHNLGYCSMIIQMCSLDHYVIFDLNTDYVEYEWICE